MQLNFARFGSHRKSLKQSIWNHRLCDRHGTGFTETSREQVRQAHEGGEGKVGTCHETSWSAAILDENPLADVIESRQRRRSRSGQKGWRPFMVCIQWRDSRCTMVLTPWGSGPKNRGMTWPESSRERLISLVCRRRRPALLIISLRNTRTSFIGFQKPQIASVACRISGTIAAGISSSRNPP